MLLSALERVAALRRHWHAAREHGENPPTAAWLAGCLSLSPATPEAVARGRTRAGWVPCGTVHDWPMHEDQAVWWHERDGRVVAAITLFPPPPKPPPPQTAAPPARPVERVAETRRADAVVRKERPPINRHTSRPVWLAHLHAALDRAVQAAYGWDDPDPAAVPEDVILARLLALNLARAGAASASRTARKP